MLVLLAFAAAAAADTVRGKVVYTDGSTAYVNVAVTLKHVASGRSATVYSGTNAILSTATKPPVVIHHPKPLLHVLTASFTQDLTGCKDPIAHRSCESDAVRALGCSSISAVDPILGGLDPKYPMAWCLVSFPKTT